MRQPSKSAEALREAIDAAIRDGVITPAEYDRLQHLAHADGHVDHEERALLSQLQDMISDGTVRRVSKLPEL